MCSRYDDFQEGPIGIISQAGPQGLGFLGGKVLVPKVSSYKLIPQKHQSFTKEGQSYSLILVTGGSSEVRKTRKVRALQTGDCSAAPHDLYWR